MRPTRIIRLKEALYRTGYTRAGWYRAMHRDPLFPQPVKLSKRCIGFREADIDALIERLSAPAVEGVRDV